MSDLDDLLTEPFSPEFTELRAKNKAKVKKRKEAESKRKAKRSLQKKTFKAHEKGPYQEANKFTKDLDDLHKAFKQATPQQLKDVAFLLKLRAKKKAKASQYGKFSFQ